MYRLLVLVLNNSMRIWDVLDAWQALGIDNATIFDSTGMHRAKRGRADLPMFPSIHDLLQATGSHHSTIWAVVKEGIEVEAVVNATEAIVGPLDQPETGIMFIVPVVKVWGFRDSEDG